MKLSEMSLEQLWQLFPIILSPYSAEWKKWYDDMECHLQSLLGNGIRRIRHIGSTSVPGMTAKPTVDILLETDLAAAEMRQTLERDGWMTMAESFEPDWRLDLCMGYTEQGFAERVFHLHVRRCGDWDEPYFCEYLRQHPDVAEQYVQLKKKLAVRFKHDRDAYTREKGDFIRKYTSIARGNINCINGET